MRAKPRIPANKQGGSQKMAQNSGFLLDVSAGYFRNAGVDVMAFDDIYPAGHQSGVSILMHGNRVATNGDIRFEQTPGQWQPLPKQASASSPRRRIPSPPACTTRIWTIISRGSIP